MKPRAGAAEEQLLGDRKQRRGEHEVRGERRGVRRLPALGHEPLLVARVQDGFEQARDQDDADEHEDGEAPRDGDARRPPQREKLANRPVPGHAEDDRHRDEELDQPGGERLPAVKRVVRWRRTGAALVLQRDEQEDEAEPDREPRVAARARRDVRHASAASASSNGAGAKCRPAARAPSRSVAPSPTCSVRSGRTPRASSAIAKIAGSGFLAPASAAVTTARKRWVSCRRSRWSCRPTSQFETTASSSPSAAARSSVAATPGSNLKRSAPV